MVFLDILYNTMIQQQTILKICDNSGAKLAKCIKVLGGYKKRFAQVGDIVVVCVLSLRAFSKNTSKVKKGCVYKALVIRTTSSIVKKNNSYYYLYDNCVVLMTNSKNPIGTRVIGPVPSLLKRKYSKFALLSAGFF
jgi:large subunit ribosomal protein L14